jgi:hypothetical protein
MNRIADDPAVALTYLRRHDRGGYDALVVLLRRVVAQTSAKRD